jgi:DeoR family fructose operon transcriptional repressor
MINALFLQERRQLILDDLKRDGRVSVKALSEKLNVSEVTIRQDLRALEDEGILERTYGGAMLRSPSSTAAELSFDIRRRKHKGEKDGIGRAAAALVKDGYGVALDSSTTTFAMIPYLKRYDGLTIVTNSLMIAQQFLDSPRIRVLLPGGTLRRDSISLVGNPASLPDINLNVGFFSAQGVTFEAGITEIGPDEAEMKRALMSRCITKVITVDATKWGKVAPYTYASAREIARIITTNTVPEADVHPFRQAGIVIETVGEP